MSNRRQCVAQFAAALVACGLIVSLLPGLSSAQDGADKPPAFPSTRGPPWRSASATYNIDNEDWTEWNRITLWV